MDVKINIEHLEEYIENGNLKVDSITFQKMLLVYNALNDGWSIKKKTAAIRTSPTSAARACNGPSAR